MAADERLYKLEPLDGSGVFLGLGVVQAGLLGGGILVGVLAISVGLPVPAAAVPVLGAAAVSFARVGGHAAWEWLPLAVGWLWATVTRGHRWAAPLPLWPVEAERAPPLPPCLAGLDIVEVPWRSETDVGAIRDNHHHRLTAVVPVSASQFVLEARAEQERLVTGWGEVLSQFATGQGAVAHIGWSDLIRPAGLHERLALAPDRSPGEADSSAPASYRELLEDAATTAAAHDTVVSITVARERLRRRSGGSADDRLRDALVSSVDALVRGLASVGLEADTPLDVGSLQRLLRRRVDPCGGAWLDRRRLGERLGLVTPCSAGPLVMESRWRSVRIDRAWHRTWWVASWPRLAVPPAWLEPFLSADGVTRTMTVAMIPVSTYRSRRRIERDLVKLESDAATKEEKGRRVDARHQRATEALLEREHEIVAGFAEMAYVGLVSLAARSEEELDEHSEIVEQLAHESGMELRALDGRQDLAWAAALPLGLAPRHLLAA